MLFSIFSLYNVYSWVIKKIYPTWHKQWHDNCYHFRSNLINDVKFLGIERGWRGLNGFSRIFLYFFRSAQIRLICSSVTRRNEIRVYPRAISYSLKGDIKDSTWVILEYSKWEPMIWTRWCRENGNLSVCLGTNGCLKENWRIVIERTSL